MSEEIDVPVEVIQALEEIRREGKYNMLEANKVVFEMNEQHMYAAVVWLAELRGDRVMVNTKRYMAALHELGETIGLAHTLSNN